MLQNLNREVIELGGYNIYCHDPNTPGMSEKLVRIMVHKKTFSMNKMKGKMRVEETKCVCALGIGPSTWIHVWVLQNGCRQKHKTQQHPINAQVMKRDMEFGSRASSHPPRRESARSRDVRDPSMSNASNGKDEAPLCGFFARGNGCAWLEIKKIL